MHAWASQPGHWLGPVTRLSLLGPAQPHGPSWTQPKNKKSVISPRIFLLNFAKYWFVLLYHKDTNLILKYPVFVKTLKNIKKIIFFFKHMTKYLKKNISYFHITKNQKIGISMYFSFNNQFIKATRTREYFKNSKKKIILFSFNIKDYELIRKMYSRY